MFFFFFRFFFLSLLIFIVIYSLFTKLSNLHSYNNKKNCTFLFIIIRKKKKKKRFYNEKKKYIKGFYVAKNYKYNHFEKLHIMLRCDGFMHKWLVFNGALSSMADISTLKLSGQLSWWKSQLSNNPTFRLRIFLALCWNMQKSQ